MQWDEKGADNVHDKNTIKGFTGEYRWLSNFFERPVEYEGIRYGSTEAAYQAQKVDFYMGEGRYDKEDFTHMSPSESKKVAKEMNKNINSDWHESKYWIMYHILTAKFTHNEDLKEKLLATGEMYLEETNWWGDTYWGVCNGVGENQLGSILMTIRDELKQNG